MERRLNSCLSVLPRRLVTRLHRWETKVDEGPGVRWLTRRGAIAYAMGLSDAGVECAVHGAADCFYFRPYAFKATCGTQ